MQSGTSNHELSVPRRRIHKAWTVSLVDPAFIVSHGQQQCWEHLEMTELTKVTRCLLLQPSLKIWYRSRRKQGHISLTRGRIRRCTAMRHTAWQQTLPMIGCINDQSLG